MTGKLLGKRNYVFDIYADATIYAIDVYIHPATSPNAKIQGNIEYFTKMDRS